MNSVDQICEKFVVQNTLDHGSAKVGPVVGMIMAAHPELRKEATNVKETVVEKINLINSLTITEIQQIAREKYPELLKEDKQESELVEGTDFIRAIINEDMKTNKYNGRVHTRFPPEPNGYLHIGHAKSILLNYGISVEYHGKFNWRFDDTNPSKEEKRYVNAMIEDAKWLGVDWEDRLLFASDYFDQFYDYAVQLIKKGLAYVDDLSVDEIREYRGSLTEPGKNSPYRNRSIEENLILFNKMKAGDFPDEARVLRAKIDMASPNLLMRDPLIYRILHKTHHNTGDKWCIYPMYDWAHGLEDSIEGITHSICTMEFEVHRQLYDWFLEQLEEKNGEPIFRPRQIEFARSDISYTILGKRNIKRLVDEGLVTSWDDPRMPTIAGVRRRGYTPEAIQNFCKAIGVSKRKAMIDVSTLENCIREDLDERCSRTMSILQPLKVIITNYPKDEVEEITIPYHPRNKEMGTRKVKFSKTIYIEREDFMENPPKDYYRLTHGKEVRLKYAYIIKCEKVLKDEKTGEIYEIHCSYDSATKSDSSVVERKVKGTIHWISALDAIKAEVRLYDRLFIKENPMEVEEGKDFTDYINPHSLEIVTAYVEPFLQDVDIGSRYQFERLGYFCVDIVDSSKDNLVFNRIITLRDSWVKK